MKLILAADNDWAIGREGGLLARLPEDMKFFRETTTGHAVVMGRKTWESLGKRPLPGRENVVLTSRPETAGDGARVFSSLPELFAAYAKDNRDLWIIGGAALYASSLDFCSEIIVSRVKMSPKGDVFFPKFEDKFVKAETILNHPQFDVVRYVRK